jgi:hypothetical protein
MDIIQWPQPITAHVACVEPHQICSPDFRGTFAKI